MNYSMIDALNLTLSAMAIVFLLLSLIMVAIMVVGKVFGTKAMRQELASDQPITSPSSEAPLTLDTLMTQHPQARVAALTALAQASQDEQGKRFEIVSIIKK